MAEILVGKVETCLDSAPCKISRTAAHRNAPTPTPTAFHNTAQLREFARAPWVRKPQNAYQTPTSFHNYRTTKYRRQRSFISSPRHHPPHPRPSRHPRFTPSSLSYYKRSISLQGAKVLGCRRRAALIIFVSLVYFVVPSLFLVAPAATPLL